MGGGHLPGKGTRLEELIRAIVLGAVQGLTEFLPISSSGHLIIVPYLLEWDASGLTFDAAVHLGTLIAVLAYFWRDWVSLSRALIASLVAHRLDYSKYDTSARLLIWLAIATVPAMIAGLLLEETVEEQIRRPEVVAVMLAAFAAVLWWVDRQVSGRIRDPRDVPPRTSVAVGVAQTLALVPGVSRSGITIAAGIVGGLDRATAARFSFLLATPIVAGAGLLKLADIVRGDGNVSIVPLFAGIVSAAVFGLLAIRYLLRYLQSRSLMIFVWYRLALAAVVLAVSAIR